MYLQDIKVHFNVLTGPKGTFQREADVVGSK